MEVEELERIPVEDDPGIPVDEEVSPPDLYPGGEPQTDHFRDGDPQRFPKHDHSIVAQVEPVGDVRQVRRKPVRKGGKDADVREPRVSQLQMGWNEKTGRPVVQPRSGPDRPKSFEQAPHEGDFKTVPVGGEEVKSAADNPAPSGDKTLDTARHGKTTSTAYRVGRPLQEPILPPSPDTGLPQPTEESLQAKLATGGIITDEDLPL